MFDFPAATDLSRCTSGGAGTRIPAVIYDFHGTLADVSSIRHHLTDRDYEGFYTNSLSCPPIQATVDAAKRTHAMGYVNMLFTGMPIEYTEGLNEWLIRHGIPVAHIDMRENGDRRKDFIVKKEMYISAVKHGYYIVRAWEDTPCVVDLWESLGIPVHVVPGYCGI